MKNSRGRSAGAVRLFAAGMALAAGVTGCQGLVPATAELPLWVHHPGDALSVRMKRSLRAADKTTSGVPERSTPAIDATHRKVFVGSSDHGLYALYAVDGSTIWRFETAGAVASEILYDASEDVVYAGSNDGALYKLRGADGHLIWRFYSASEITRRPVVDGDTVYVTNAADTLIAIDRATGKHRWHQQQPSTAGMEIAGYAGVATHGDKVFTAFSDGRLMAFRKSDGAPMWDLRLTNQVEQTEDDLLYWDVDTTPVVAHIEEETVVLAASYEGGVFAVGADSGMPRWHNDGVTGVTELMTWQATGRERNEDGTQVIHRRVIASSGRTGVWSLALSDGAQQWRRDVPSGGVSRAVPWSGALLVGTTRYGMFLLHPLDGGVIDGVHSGGVFAAPAATHGNQSFALSGNGTLWGFEITPPG